MVYNSRCQEDDSVRETQRDRQREQRLADKSLATAHTIAEFFEAHTGSCSVIKPANPGSEPTKAEVLVTKVGLNIRHRNHEISVACEDPATMAKTFRDWIGRHMTHVTKINVQVS